MLRLDCLEVIHIHDDHRIDCREKEVFSKLCIIPSIPHLFIKCKGTLDLAQLPASTLCPEKGVVGDLWKDKQERQKVSASKANRLNKINHRVIASSLTADDFISVQALLLTCKTV